MSNIEKPAGQRVAPRGPNKRPMNPLFMGIIIGLLLGILLALGIALWLNRSANPFIEKTRPVDALPTINPREPAAKADVAKPGPTGVGSVDGKDGSDKPRFEFYQILPGEKNPAAVKKGAEPAAEKPVPAANPATGKSPPPAAPANAKSPPARTDADPAEHKEFYLQAGAFQSESDAENLKAKIAFAGLEAQVRGVNLSGRGTLYRVRLGPYQNLDEMNRNKAILSQNGINAAVVRPE
jgi:cell division protein FtsN